MQQPAVIWGSLVAILIGAIGVAFWFFNRQQVHEAAAQIRLPSSVMGWQRAADGQHYDPETIFSYIDGHAEVYLAYGMKGCDAERYTGPGGEPDLILDIFEMASSADAFGVFTHDTEGEGVGIGRDSRYRYGWLSFWQGSNFVSIVAEGETERAEQATLELGRQVAALLPTEGVAPSILGALPGAGLETRTVRYLHHPQILNTHLPIDPENLLDLGMSWEPTGETPKGPTSWSSTTQTRTEQWRSRTGFSNSSPGLRLKGALRNRGRPFRAASVRGIAWRWRWGQGLKSGLGLFCRESSIEGENHEED